MSIYPVQYPSKSKGPVDIETMADTHLCNAVRKIERELDEADTDVYLALGMEMQRRGLKSEYKSGRPPQEQPPLTERERELAEWANQPDFPQGEDR